MACFITLEGGEGSGKTTQIRLLREALLTKEFPVTPTREPGGTPVGQMVRAILLDGEHPPIDPLAELLLYSADRAQHVAEVIQPALADGHVVLCDRFTDATLAYQGYGRRLELATIIQLNLTATRGLLPNLTLLLDCPVETGLGRSKARLQKENSREDRFENEEIAFHERVRQGYLELAKANAGRFRVFDATLPPQELHVRILAEVLKFLGGQK